MARETLKLTESRAVFAYRSRCFRCYTLVGAGFDELANPEAARVPGRKFGWQGVIRADHFVTIGDIGFGPKKQRTENGSVIPRPYHLAILLRLERHDQTIDR